MNKFNCPLSLICNPFFIKFKLLDTEILKNVIKNIEINKSDIIYITTNITKNSIDYNIKDDIKHIRDIDKKINNLSNNDFDLIFKFEDYTPLNTSPLNNDEMNIAKNLINKYKKEYIRVLRIKLNFINNYIDATKLKNSHLNTTCAKRQHITSNCDIKNFLNAIKNKNHTIKSIKDEYYKILHLNKITNITINNSHIECCFIINKIDYLFCNYLKMILYCLKIIQVKPYIIREQLTFLFDIETNNSYFYEIDSSIYINHMNVILNIKIEKNDNIYNSNFVKLCKTQTRNDVYFI
jgi:hypothetical protein